ncbi:SRPBCC family protein [Arenibacterium halophilum]|uniref:Polyketide cyclase n=1 Tax=Arenibacterium halophilum TaxID=2583821 RepID=A0ABY2X7X3_9RHOB|nr:SRPBCC family protein [Arenibacterium halophilum]TMV11899.1 polyketide cyclase [Arenibacterium halophilum]
MNLNPETDLTFTRTLAAPRTVLWKCWTTPDHIKHFFVPKPHSIESCDIDLRVGGRFNTVMNVDGTLYDNKGIWLDVIPMERLVFTDGYTEGWVPAADPFMTAILDFADDGQGGTTYTATARHRSAEACKRHKDMGFFDGWGTVATQLETYAQSLS